jgi:hypothetical protein
MSEERYVDPDTGAEKGKKAEEFAYMPVKPLEAVARVYGMGAKKYEPRNWERGYDWSLSYSALQRHLHAFWGGEDTDPESGESHLAHAVFHCLALMDFSETHPEKDDRSVERQFLSYPVNIIPEEVELEWVNGYCESDLGPHKHGFYNGSERYETGCPRRACGTCIDENGCNYGLAGHLITCLKAQKAY